MTDSDEGKARRKAMAMNIAALLVKHGYELDQETGIVLRALAATLVTAETEELGIGRDDVARLFVRDAAEDVAEAYREIDSKSSGPRH